MWLRIVKRSFECFIIWWTIRSLLISALAFDCFEQLDRCWSLPLRSIVLTSFKKNYPFVESSFLHLDIYVSSTPQNIGQIFPKRIGNNMV